MAWLTGWSKRKKITLTGGASGAQTAFQIKLTVAYDGDMQSDFDDLRFTQADGQTLIDAWLETKVDDTSATVWAEFPTTPANVVEQTYYMYYGNGGVASDWDGDATFEFFDDFNRANSGTVGNGWTESHDGSFSIENNMLKAVWVSGNNYAECYRAPPIGDYVYEWRIKASQTNSKTYTILHDLPLDNRLGAFFTSAGRIGIYCTESTILGNYAADTFYNFKMTYHSTSDNFDLLVSGGIGSANAQTPHAGPADTRFRFVTGTSTGTFYCDHILVRKYAANPATYAFGAEESAPTGAAPTSVFIGPFGGPFGGPIQ